MLMTWHGMSFSTSNFRNKGDAVADFGVCDPSGASPRAQAGRRLAGLCCRAPFYTPVPAYQQKPSQKGAEILTTLCDAMFFLSTQTTRPDPLRKRPWVPSRLLHCQRGFRRDHGLPPPRGLPSPSRRRPKTDPWPTPQPPSPGRHPYGFASGTFLSAPRRRRGVWEGGVA